MAVTPRDYRNNGIDDPGQGCSRGSDNNAVVGHAKKEGPGQCPRDNR